MMLAGCLPFQTIVCLNCGPPPENLFVKLYVGLCQSMSVVTSFYALTVYMQIDFWSIALGRVQVSERLVHVRASK